MSGEHESEPQCQPPVLDEWINSSLKLHVKLKRTGCTPGHLYHSVIWEETDDPPELSDRGELEDYHTVSRAEGHPGGIVSTLGLALAGNVVTCMPEGHPEPGQLYGVAV